VTPADVQATCCATLVDEWIRHGVEAAVIAPGSRSTPMALAVADRPELAVHVVHDERAAGFVALGLALAGRPALLLCTSGTAAANLHPAVVEAGLSDVAMIVLTADRPNELRDVGAPQTIDQTHLFGRSVRWFHDPGVPDVAAASSWRSLARRAVDHATRGPVHLNLPFREPLLGRAGELPPRREHLEPRRARLALDVPSPELAALDHQRGVILAGGRSGVEPELVAQLAAATGWPVLVDPTSGLAGRPGVIACADALLRHEGFASDHRPGLVIRIGRPAASKVLAQWIAGSGATVLQVGGPGTIDPDHTVAATIDADDVAALSEAWRGATGTPWAARWRSAADTVEGAIERWLAAGPELCEPAVARTVATHLPADAELVVASSMPVRDLEWFGGPGARAHANRGANGIDGVVSTALGIALGGRPVVALVGDVAFVHDAGSLTALSARSADLRIVVVDNDGGGIFSFLPQAERLEPDRFEQLFGTPHGTDVVALARAHGLDATTVTTRAQLVERITSGGPSVTRVATDRAENVRVHRELHAAAVAALG
jgi:2-succinyl-5-enolpyruvyl-6-hydroxy-3-cyclohexene-1-carboxylate synthase